MLIIISIDISSMCVLLGVHIRPMSARSPCHLLHSFLHFFTCSPEREREHFFFFFFTLYSSPLFFFVMIECDDLQLNLSFSGPEKEKEKEEGEGKGSVGARSLRRNRLGQGQGRRVQGEGQREGLRKGLDNSSLRGGRAKSLGRQGAVEKPKPSSNRENPAPVSVVPEKEDSPSLLLGNKKSSTNVVEIERRRKREESRLDDPMQYHARPRELSRNATDVKQLTRSEYIFTRRSFSSINIPEKIVKVLEKDVSDGEPYFLCSNCEIVTPPVDDRWVLIANYHTDTKCSDSCIIRPEAKYPNEIRDRFGQNSGIFVAYLNRFNECETAD